MFELTGLLAGGGMVHFGKGVAIYPENGKLVIEFTVKVSFEDDIIGTQVYFGHTLFDTASVVPPMHLNSRDYATIMQPIMLEANSGRSTSQANQLGPTVL